MKIRQLLIFTLFLSYSNMVFAYGENLTLVKILASIKTQIQTLKKTYDTAKTSSDILSDLKDTSKAIYEEYKFIDDFSIDRELANILGDFDSLRSLDSFDKLSTEGKYRFIQRQLDQRVMSEKESALYSARINELKRLEELRLVKLQEAKNVGQMNDKTLKASAASSGAIMSALALMEKEEKERERLAEQVGVSQKMEYEKDFFSLMKNEAKKSRNR